MRIPVLPALGSCSEEPGTSHEGSKGMLQTMKGCGPGYGGLCRSFAHACEAVFQGYLHTPWDAEPALEPPGAPFHSTDPDSHLEAGSRSQPQSSHQPNFGTVMVSAGRGPGVAGGETAENRSGPEHLGSTSSWWKELPSGVIDTQVGTEVVALVQERVGWLDQEHSSVGQEDAVSPRTLRGWLVV